MDRVMVVFRKTGQLTTMQREKSYVGRKNNISSQTPDAIKSRVSDGDGMLRVRLPVRRKSVRARFSTVRLKDIDCTTREARRDWPE